MVSYITSMQLMTQEVDVQKVGIYPAMRNGIYSRSNLEVKIKLVVK